MTLVQDAFFSGSVPVLSFKRHFSPKNSITMLNGHQCLMKLKVKPRTRARAPRSPPPRHAHIQMGQIPDIVITRRSIARRGVELQACAV